MLTPTHTLLALAALAKSDDRKRNTTVIFGSLLPDLPISFWALYQALINDVSQTEMWDQLYFEAPMQNLIAWFNSIPIYLGFLFIGLVARGKIWGKLLIFFALAALIHIAADMPVHADDAYRHFWPLSEWRFYSPLSYWDTDHHAFWVSKIDVAIALACIAILWQRFPLSWAKFTLGLTIVFYMAVLAAPLVFG